MAYDQNQTDQHLQNEFKQEETPAIIAQGLPIVESPTGATLKTGDFTSPNYRKSRSGWKVDANGNAEFQSIILSGKNVLWTYYNKVTFTAETATKTFSALQVHDEWMVIVSLYNTVATARIDPVIRLNAVSATNYQYVTMDNSEINTISGITGYKVVSMSGDAVVLIKATVVIDGKHNNGTKCLRSPDSSCGNLITVPRAIWGHLISDTNDLTSISIISAANATGTIQLWYRDNN